MKGRELRNSFDGTPASYTPSPSTSTELALRSGAVWLASETIEVQEEFLDSLGENELMVLPYLFEFWALPHQLPPQGQWFTWVIMGGRGAGKTRAGAEWVRSMVEGSSRSTRGGRAGWRWSARRSTRRAR